MPYELRGKCVVKPGGEVVKCHTSLTAARRHLRALYANVPDARLKAPNYGAQAGQTIAGNLARDQGGKFASGGSTGAARQARRQSRKPKMTPAQRFAQRRATRDQTLQAAGLNASEAATLSALVSGQPVTEMRAAQLIKLGLVEQLSDGSIIASPAARKAANAAERGDLERVQEAFSQATDRIKRAEDRKRRTQERDRRRNERRAAMGSRRQGENKPQQGSSRDDDDRGSAPKLARGRHGGSDKRAQMTYRRRQIARKSPDFAVFKANGRYRWILISSNAYRDRDQEIVSQKALEGAVAIADKTGYRGPLRWWHVPGLDIGDCDFQAMHGRFLIESGTFRDERIGAAVARKAHALQASIGFTHPPSDPDASGVFHHIAIFERSLTPHGRASNVLTRLAVKKDRSMDNVKKEALKQLLNDDAFLDELLQRTGQTDQAMEAAGVDFKSADPEPAAEKATDDSDMEVDEEQPLLTTKEIELIGDHVAERLSGMLDLPNQMRALMDRMTGMIGEQSKKKDDAIAALKEQSDKRSAAIERRLKTLEGDQPKSFHRASESNDNLADEETIKALGAPGADKDDPFAKMSSFLFG